MKKRLVTAVVLIAALILAVGGTLWLRGEKFDHPVNDLPGVTFEAVAYDPASGEVAVRMTNQSDGTLSYGAYYELQKLRGEVWYTLPQTPSRYPRGWIAIEYLLEPGEREEFTVLLRGIYFPLGPGRYRVVKDAGYDEHWLAAEFVIQ